LTPNFLKGVREPDLERNGLGVLRRRVGKFRAGLLLQPLQSAQWIFWRRCWFLIRRVDVAGTGLPVFMLGYFLIGGFRAARPMAMAQARELVHDSQMGLAYGTMETVSAIIFIIAPPIAGFIFERDPFIVYPLAIGLIAVSIVISYFFSPRKATTEALKLP
jgi:MFS family permease